MSTSLCFRRDAASEAQVAALLRRCDASFIPPLSSRVALTAYARKIVSHAVRLEAWDGAEPVALLAMYCNDPDGGSAYITSVSVAPGWERRGIASALLGAACRHARAAGMRAVALEVDASNHAALHLYQKHGFRAQAPAAPAIRMQLDLAQNGPAAAPG